MVRNNTESYTYDPVGNRQAGPKTTDGYAYNSANELLSYSGHPNKGNNYEYDLNGNLIKKTETIQGNAKLITSYTYDDENRLIYVTIAKGAKTKEISFAYDPFGRRISKTIEKDELNDDNSTNKKDYPLTIFYIYDNQNIIAEYDQTGKQTATYIHGPNIDEPLAADINNTRIYYHADGLGSITTLTNHMGQKVQQYAYDAFGNIKSTPFWIKQPYTFTAREFDYETGLYFYRARYYDPKVGRFVTKDPIGFGGGINRYLYSGQNSINFTDPYGLKWGDSLGMFIDWVPGVGPVPSIDPNYASKTTPVNNATVNNVEPAGPKTCPTRDCLKEFGDCMANTLAEILDIALGVGEAGSSYYEALAWQHAASRNLTVPLRSSIVRNYLARGRVFLPYAVVGTFLVAEGICLNKEIQCVNSQ